MIHKFETLTSSNDEAQSDIYHHGDIVVAERQTAGRGQRGNKWVSGEGLNLTLSAVVALPHFEVRRQFLISQAVALAICDTLRSYNLNPRIKWTNDIYIGEFKIAGILIENRLCGGLLARSVVGIGLNVNQKEFDPSLPNPTSMAVAAGREFDRDEVLERLEKALLERTESLLSDEGEAQIVKEYHALLYRRDQMHNYRLRSGEICRGMLRGVEATGELIIDWDGGKRGTYLFGEIEFMIESRKR